MTKEKAYAELVRVNRQIDELVKKPRLTQAQNARHDALMVTWSGLCDVLDPEMAIDYRDDISVFAPSRPAPTPGQMELFS